MNIIDALEELAVQADVQVRFGCEASEYGAVRWSVAAYRHQDDLSPGSTRFEDDWFAFGKGPTLHGALTRMLESLKSETP